jgi:hypothetical protein
MGRIEVAGEPVECEHVGIGRPPQFRTFLEERPTQICVFHKADYGIYIACGEAQECRGTSDFSSLDYQCIPPTK